MERKIAVEKFDRDRIYLYEDELGWTEYVKKEAKSNNSKEIFKYVVDRVGYNMSFFYTGNNNFYSVFSEVDPIEVKLLTYDKPDAEWVFWRRMDTDPHSNECVILGEYKNADDIWDNFKIEGKSLEEVLEKSLILDMC